MDPIPIDPRRTNAPWGVIHPSNTGVVWQVKCGGRSVGYQWVEGVFFPFPRPVDNGEDLLSVLHQRNREEPPDYREADPDIHEDVWEAIKEATGFDFLIIDPPTECAEYVEPADSVPRNQEGLLWIEITEVTSHWDDWIGDLPEPLVLVPGNSD